MPPNVIYCHARGERILRGDKPVSQVDTISPRVFRLELVQHRERAVLDGCAFVQEIAAHMDVGWSRTPSLGNGLSLNLAFHRRRISEHLVESNEVRRIASERRLIISFQGYVLIQSSFVCLNTADRA